MLVAETATLPSAILYVSYDGMLEPLGQSQVLAYLERLTLERSVYLISFEKPSDLKNRKQFAHLTDRMARARITWIPLTYHKTPVFLATAWDVLVGCVAGWRLITKEQIQIVHARSYVASVIALVLKRLSKTKFIFDMRGFWVDERVEGGLWRKNGMAYRIAKRFERLFLASADHIVVLTKTAVSDLSQIFKLNNHPSHITVIPTCVDLVRFKKSEKLLPSTDRSKFVLGYVGSVGTWYQFEKVLESFILLVRKKSNATLLIINKNQHSYILKQLSSYKIPLNRVQLLSAQHAEVPQHIALMDAGIFYIKPTFSKRASAPTRLAEYLACGVPCLTNSGVGDVDEFLLKYKVGIVTKSFEEADLSEALDRLIDLASTAEIQDNCRHAAYAEFSLVNGTAKYENIYRGLDA